MNLKLQLENMTSSWPMVQHWLKPNCNDYIHSTRERWPITLLYRILVLYGIVIVLYCWWCLEKGRGKMERFDKTVSCWKKADHRLSQLVSDLPMGAVWLRSKRQLPERGNCWIFKHTRGWTVACNRAAPQNLLRSSENHNFISRDYFGCRLQQ